jgi:hypothetical protein
MPKDEKLFKKGRYYAKIAFKVSGKKTVKKVSYDKHSFFK